MIQKQNSQLKIASTHSARTKRMSWTTVVLVCAYVITSVVGGFVDSSQASAAIPKYINFQGKLTAVSNGTNVANGTYAIEFKIYDALTSGTLLWTETYDQAPTDPCQKIQVTNGVFNTKLGSCASLAGVDFTGGSLFLTVNFAPTGTSYDGEMSPRKQLVSSAFAFVANGVSGDGVVNSAVSSATALAIAKAGSNYALQVDTSAGSAATGLKVTSAAAAGGVALAAISSGTNENLTLNAKGSGTISIGNVSTGNVLFGSSGQLSITSAGILSTSGNISTTGSGTVTSAGLLTSTGGLTSSGTITFSGLGGAGTKCLQTDNSGVVTAAAAACGTGALTPWTSDVDADGFDLRDLSNLEFRDTTGSPAGSVVAVFSDNTGDLNLNSLTGKTTNIQVNGTDEYNFSSTALAMNSNNITGVGTAITATAGLTVTATSADLTLATATSGNVVLNSTGGTIELQDATNVTGALDVSTTLAVGTADAFTVNSSGAITAVVGITNTGAQSTTVQSATALTVARTGTNYALQVDTNTASSATGIKVTANAAASGVAIAAISSGTDEFLTLDAKGAGEVRIAGASTGSVLFAGGYGSTGCTITSSGSLSCDNTIASASTFSGPQYNLSGDTALSWSGTIMQVGNSGAWTAVDILGGSASTGCTILNASGNLTCSGTGSFSNLSGTNTGDVTLAAIGATPNANGATLTGQALNLQPANGSFGGVVTTTTQTFAGAKTFTSDLTVSKVDPSLVLVAPGLDTDFWLSVTDDAGNDDNDAFQIGNGATPGTNTLFSMDNAGWITLTTGARVGLLPNNSFEFASGQQTLQILDGGYFMDTYNASGSGGYMELTGRTVDDTSGTIATFKVSPTVSPTSGTLTYAAAGLYPTINQTGTATGISRGLYVNPTITSSKDFRGMEASYTITGALSASSNYGSKIAITNNQITNANTVYGQHISFTDAGSLANTVTGLYVDATTANTSDTTYAAIFQGGNVGIGNTAPSQKLVVDGGSGNGYFGFDVSTPNPTLYLRGDATNGYYPNIDFAPQNNAALGGVIQSNSVNGGLYVGNRGVNGALTVTNDVSNRTNTILDELVISHNTTGTPAANYGTGILISGETTTTAAQDMSRIAAYWTDATHATRTSNLGFSTVNSGTMSEKLTIQGSGNVGIGTTGPDRKLDVLDASNPQLRLTQADGTVYSDLQTDGSGDLSLRATGDDFLFLDNSLGSGAKFALSDLSSNAIFDLQVYRSSAYVSRFLVNNLGIVTVGDAAGTGNGTQLFVNDSGSDISLQGVDQVSIGDGNGSASSLFVKVNNTSQQISADSAAGTFLAGDVNGTGANDILFTIDDPNQKFTFENGSVGIGTTGPDAKLELAGSMTQAAWGLNGIQLQATASTYTDSSTAVSGTATNAVFNSFAQPTLAATNATVTTTNASTVYIANAPAAGTNQTITNAYALWVDDGNVRFDGNLTVTGTCTGCGGGSFSGEVDDTTNDSLTFTSDDASAPAGTVNSIFRDNTGDMNINTVTGKTLNVQIAGADEYNFSATALAMNSNNITGVGTAITATAGLTVTATSADLNLATATSGNINLNSTGGTIELQDATNVTGALDVSTTLAVGTADAFTVSAAGSTTIATGQSYTGAGTVTLSSATASALTIESGTTGTITIGGDSSAETISIGLGAAAKNVFLGSSNTTSLTQVQAGSTGLSLLTSGAGNIALAPNTTGSVQVTSGVTTGTGTSSGLSVVTNSLTTGVGVNLASSSLSSGSLLNLAVTGTAGLDNQKGINVSMSGANGTGAQTTYGGYFSNTHTGTSTNIGLYATATGGTNNYAAIFEAGNVGIGTTAPSVLLNLSTTGAPTDFRADTYSDTDWHSSRFRFTRARDIPSSPDAVLTGDALFEIAGLGYQNAGYRQGVNIVAAVDAAPSGNFVPTNLQFWLMNASTEAEVMRLTSGFDLGLGTSAPGKRLEINHATGQNLRLTYNDSDGSATNYADLLTTATGDLSVVPSGGDVAITGNLDVSGTIFAGTGDAFQVSSAGAVTAVGVNSGAGLLQGQLGLTVTGAAVNLNASSNFDVNIATGTSTGTINLGGTGAQSIQVGSGIGVKTITIGNAADDTFSLASSGLNVSTGGAITGASGIVSSGTIQFSTLTANGPLYTSGGNGTLTTTAPTSGAIGYWSRTGTVLSQTTANDTVSIANSTTTGADLALTNSGVYTGTGVLNLTANSATTGTLASITGNGLTTGNLLSLSSSSAAATTGQKGLNVALTGALTGAQTTYGGYFSNTRTGATAVNVGLYATASGATGANYAGIFEAGSVGIGTTTPAAKLDIMGFGASSSQNIRIRNEGQSAQFAFEVASSTQVFHAPQFSTLRARGTLGSPSVVSSGDVLFLIDAAAYDSNSYESAARITFDSDGASGDNDVPGRITFATTADGGVSPTERLRVESSGEIGIGTTAPDKQLEINHATGQNLRLTYNDSDGSATNYADLLTTATGDLSVVPSGGDVGVTGSVAISSILQVASATGTTYSRFGTGTTTHSGAGNIENATDLLLSDDLEVDGDAWFDGNLTVTGTCTGCGGGSFSGEVDDTTNDSLTFTSDDASAPAGTVNSIFRDNTGDLNINTVTGKTLNLQIAGADEYNFSSTALALNSNNITGVGTAITAAAALTLSTAAASDLTLDSGTTGAVNLGTGNNAKTISIGTGNAGNGINIGTNNTVADTIAIGSALDSTTIRGSTITIGNAADASVSIIDNNWSVTTAGVATFVTGSVIGSQTFTTNNIADSGALTIATGANGALTLNPNGTGALINTLDSVGDINDMQLNRSGTLTSADSSADILASRTVVTNSAGSLNSTANFVQFTSNISGTGTDTGSVLGVTQSNTSASGAVVSLAGAGTGNLISADTTNSSANGALFDIQSSSASQYALMATVNNGGTTALRVGGDGFVGLNTTGADRRLDILDSTNPQLRLSQADGTVYGDLQSTTTANLIVTGDNLTSSSAKEYGLQISPTINQTSAASYTALDVNVTETAATTANGLNRLADFKVGGSSKLAIANDGTLTLQNASNLVTAYGSLGAFQNHLVRSEEFDNASWTKSNVTAPTANTQTAPDGSTTAESLVSTVNGGYAQQATSTAITGVDHTFSVWVRSASGTQAFDLELDGTTGGTAIVQSHTATTSWQRFSVTGTVSGGTGNVQVRIYPGGTGSTGTIYVANAQLEVSSRANAYALTTGGALTNTNRGESLVSNFATTSGFTYGGRHIINLEGAISASSSTIGQLIRVNDNATGTDDTATVRALEVQSFSGTNINGVNTAIAAFGYTFGVHAVSTGQANESAQPAAVFADLDNGSAPTQGNAIRAYSNNLTSADLVSFYQETTTFTGNGLEMNFGNSSGAFSGNFISLQKAGTQYFHVDDDGSTHISVNGTATNFGICLAADGNVNDTEIVQCNGAPTDLAENFGTTDSTIEAGDVVVSANDALAITTQDGTDTSKAWITKSATAYQNNLLGVVSTQPNQVYGTDGLFKDSENPRPVSLAGRVPVKVTNENGNINAGDYLTSSSTQPGKAMKATRSGMVIGQALSSYDGTGEASVIVFVNTGYQSIGNTIVLDAPSTNGVNLQSGAENLTANTASTFVIQQQTADGEQANAPESNILQLQTGDANRFMVSSTGATSILSNLSCDPAASNSDCPSVLKVTQANTELMNIDARGTLTLAGTIFIKDDSFAGSVATDSDGLAEITFSYHLGTGKPVVQLTAEAQLPVFAQIVEFKKDEAGNYTGFVMKTFDLISGPIQAIVHYTVVGKQADYITLGEVQVAPDYSEFSSGDGNGGSGSGGEFVGGDGVGLIIEGGEVVGGGGEVSGDFTPNNSDDSISTDDSSNSNSTQ